MPSDVVLAQAGWFQLALLTPDQHSLAGFDLDVGTLDGRRTHRYSARYGPLTPAAAFEGALPVAAGPYGELVFVAHWDGQQSDLRAVSVLSGSDELLLRRDDIIHAIAYDATTDSLFLLTLDEETRSETAILRLARSRPEDQELLTTSSVPPPVGTAIWKRLWVTPNGSQLVIMNCPDRCVARVEPLLPGGIGGTYAIGDGDVVGVTNAEILTVFECEPPCGATRYDLISGRPTSIGVFCETGTLATVDGRSAMISDWPTRVGCQGTSYSVGRTDLSSDERVHVLEHDDRQRKIVVSDATQGVAPPEGWFVLGPGGKLIDASDNGIAPLLVRAQDGAEFELRAPDPPRR